MPLFIVKDDITRMKVDAIVNAANNTLLGGGGVDGCIHAAAGHELLKECASLNGCETGNAKITKGYRLPAKYVIHTVGPIWRGGNYNEENLLISCYNRSLELAIENHCQSVAFPMISAGVYGYPKKAAMKVAQNTINKFLSEQENDIDVYLVLFGRDTSEFFEKSDDIDKFIKEFSNNSNNNLNDSSTNSADNVVMPPFSNQMTPSTKLLLRAKNNLFGGWVGCLIGDLSEKILFSNKEKNVAKDKCCREPEPCCKESASKGLNDALENAGENFASMVMRKINEQGLNEVKCYKAANVTKQIFSKIRNSAYGEDSQYQPTKNTAIAFAIALKLPINEAKELLEKAGYAFSKSNKFDIIVEYCISKNVNDVLRVNEILFTYNQPLLGSGARG